METVRNMLKAVYGYLWAPVEMESGGQPSSSSLVSSVPNTECIPAEMESGGQPSSSSLKSNIAVPSSSAEDAESSEQTQDPESVIFHIDVRMKRGDFYTPDQLEAGADCKLHLGAFQGVRRSDGQPVAIRYITRYRSGESPDSCSRPLCEETEALMKFLKPPTSDRFIRIHEVFITEHCDVLITEPLPSFITLGEFIQQKGKDMKETDVKTIMWQLFEAQHHCWERGVVLPISLEGIAIDPKTLQIKIIDFHRAEHIVARRGDQGLSEEWLKVRMNLRHSENLSKVMEALLQNIRCPAWKRRRLSRECKNLLWRLETYQGFWLLKTFQDVFTDPWFETVEKPNN